MKIEIKIETGSFTEDEAALRMASFLRREVNKQRAIKKVIGIPELDDSPEKAKQFISDYLSVYGHEALKSGCQIYHSVLGRKAGQEEADEKLKK